MEVHKSDFAFSGLFLGGAKFPSVDSSRLKEEFHEIEIEGTPESGIHGHDLTLGTGSSNAEKDQRVKGIERLHLEGRIICASERSTLPLTSMAVSTPSRRSRKKFVACAVFTMIGAGVAASCDLRWQSAIRKTQETRS
jgi:hypothetical protein